MDAFVNFTSLYEMTSSTATASNVITIWRTSAIDVTALIKKTGQGHFLFKVGHRSRSRSQVVFCMSGKTLSQGTYMPNMKALSETVQKL